ncbi:hypothetical protein [Rhabdochromatium marinum]|nr:hypothetical protein [Rhabdochromatium marinum]
MHNPLCNTPEPDRCVFTAEAQGRLVGSSVFSRLIYEFPADP